MSSILSSVRWSSSASFWSRVLAARAFGLVLTAGLVSFGPGTAAAQLTDPGDSDPTTDGQIRFEIENSSGGDVIDVNLGGADSLQTISLRETLVFDNNVELDNSDVAFGLVDLDAPAAAIFLQIDDGVSVILRDIGLARDATNTSDDISLVGAGSALTLDTERAGQLVDVDIVGPGTLRKEGSNSLQLLGNNTLFTGGITVVDGDLIGEVQFFGTGAIDLAADDTGKDVRVIFDFAGTDILDGSGPSIIDMTSGGGTASVLKRGSGSLDISAATISSSLAIDIEQGEVLISAANLTNGNDFAIGSGTTLRLDAAPGVVTSSSTISGSGLFETEVDDLTLMSDPSDFTGTLDISVIAGSPAGASSTVTVEPATAPANDLSFDVVVNAASEFEIDTTGDLTFSGDVSGSGSFAKAGIGVATLTGAHTQTGETALRGGTLIASTSTLPAGVAFSDGTTLVISQDVDGALGGTLRDVSLTGSARVRKLGSGVLTLMGTHDFRGRFLADRGGVHFPTGTEFSTASLTVGTGAGGEVTNLTGSFDPTGVLDNQVDIGGSLDFASDSRITIGVAATTNRNLSFAAGEAVMIQPGATLAIAPDPGAYFVGLTWDVITGATVTGDFEVEQSLFFFDINGTIVGNTYRLALASSARALTSVEATSNQVVVAPLLDTFRVAIAPMPTTRETEYQESLTSITIAEVGSVLDSVSPDDLSASTQLQLANANRTWRGISDRVALDRRGWIGRPEPKATPRRVRPSVSAAPGGAKRAPAVPQREGRPWMAWIEGAGLMGELGSSDAKELEYLSVGPIVGADKRLTDNVLAGFALAGTYGLYETKEGANKGDGGSVEATLYGSVSTAPVDVLVGARYARAWVNTERLISVGAQSNVAEGELEGDIFGIFAEASRAFDLGDGIEVAPLVSLAYTRLMWGAFDEDGQSPLRVRVDEQEIDSVLTSVGVRISAERKMQQGILLRPRFKLLWNHEWGDTARDVAGRFETSLVTSAFTVQGAELTEDHAEVALGWEVGFVRNANLYLDWEGRFGKDLIENALSVGGRIAW